MRGLFGACPTWSSGPSTSPLGRDTHEHLSADVPSPLRFGSRESTRTVEAGSRSRLLGSPSFASWQTSGRCPMPGTWWCDFCGRLEVRHLQTPWCKELPKYFPDGVGHCHGCSVPRHLSGVPPKPKQAPHDPRNRCLLLGRCRAWWPCDPSARSQYLRALWRSIALCRRLTIVGGVVKRDSVAAGAERKCAPAAPIGHHRAVPQLYR